MRSTQINAVTAYTSWTLPAPEQPTLRQRKLGQVRDTRRWLVALEGRQGQVGQQHHAGRPGRSRLGFECVKAGQCPVAAVPAQPSYPRHLRLDAQRQVGVKTVADPERLAEEVESGLEVSAQAERADQLQSRSGPVVRVGGEIQRAPRGCGRLGMTELRLGLGERQGDLRSLVCRWGLDDGAGQQWRRGLGRAAAPSTPRDGQQGGRGPRIGPRQRLQQVRRNLFERRADVREQPGGAGVRERQSSRRDARRDRPTQDGVDVPQHRPCRQDARRRQPIRSGDRGRLVQLRQPGGVA